jgi:Protein of unknown function (DUF3592)
MVAELLPVILVFALVAFALAVMGGFWTALASTSWPTVQGEIVSLDMGIDNTTRGPRYTPKVRYRYRVAGKDYESSRIDMTSQRKFYSQAAADAVLLAYRINGPVAVHYDPRRPEKSLLKPGVSSATWVITVLVIVLLALLATVGPG